MNDRILASIAPSLILFSQARDDPWRMIDWTHIGRLEDDLGVEEVSALIPVFLEEVENAIQPLRDGGAPTEMALHFLKGCAVTLGFCELAQRAGEGEDQLKQNEKSLPDTEGIILAYTREREELLAKFRQQ